MRLTHSVIVLASLCLAGTVHAASEVVEETLSMIVEQVSAPAAARALADLDVTITYRSGMQQADYPDFIALENDLRRWIAAPADAAQKDEARLPPGWPAAPGELCRQVLASYATIDALTLTARPYPTTQQPFAPAYSATLHRGAAAPERAMSVQVLRLGLDQQGPNVIDAALTASYADGIDPATAPAAAALRTALREQLINYPEKSHYWETMARTVSANLLEAYAVFASATLQLKIYPTATLTYPHEVQTSLTRATKPPASAEGS